ncbi:MAG TPA: methyl-accepting chemotaxis protein [Stenomitos sp.]
MFKLFRTSIQAKTLGFLGISLFLTMLVSNLFSGMLLGRSLDDLAGYNAQNILGPSQAALIQNLMPTGNAPLVQTTLEHMVNDTVKQMTVYRTDGQATFASDPAKRHTMDTDPQLLAILKQTEPQIRMSKEHGERFFTSYYPIKANESCAACHAGVKPGDIRGFVAMKTTLKHNDALVTNQTVRNMLFTLLLLAILLFIMRVILSRTVTNPLRRVTEVAEAIAAGNLDQQLDVAGEDEMGRMAESQRRMIESLQHVVWRVRKAAATVEGGVEQISANAEQLAQSSQSQAGEIATTSRSMERMATGIEQVASSTQALAKSVEDSSSSIEEMTASIRQVANNSDTLSSAVGETSASIEEMTATIKQVALNVEEANRAAEHAAATAQDGRHAVRQTIEGMQQINKTMGEVVQVIQNLGKSSGEIGAIIEVIDDISDQTNLLALNAAIEAARAGEAGRGFAVVADEVRKLAERSSRATAEIADLIKGIQSETSQAITFTNQGNEAIQKGSSLAEGAGQALEAIVSSVGDASSLMARIALATQEQARTADLITNAVERMSAMTLEVANAAQEQAKGSEQIVRAVDSMNAMTMEVNGITADQRRGSQEVVQAIESINRSAQETVKGTSLIAESAASLQHQANDLLEAIAFFKTAQAEAAQTLSLVVERAALEAPKG